MHASAGKNHYKLCAWTVIVLIALWSLFTGTVTLKWSTNNLNQFLDGLDSMILEDLDVLEVEEREKTVRHMWDVVQSVIVTPLKKKNLNSQMKGKKLYDCLGF
ncbi:unnamed protein product [Vicia faba]|uniref:Uncharacterized protein n=1 Tax=Vicia faba TaxID=3906 RepID=A0AAV0ZPW9_VICFA|nr:unnamed protein product [Vicia faba]